MPDFDTTRLREALRQAGVDARAGAQRGLRLGAEHLLQTSRALTPTEEGTLERSGKVSEDPATLRAAVSFNTPYAVTQHEDLTFKHDPGRRAKYLETPMATERGTVAKLVGTAVRAELGA